jgi:hypothetical protein
MKEGNRKRAVDIDRRDMSGASPAIEKSAVKRVEKRQNSKYQSTAYHTTATAKTSKL